MMVVSILNQGEFVCGVANRDEGILKEQKQENKGFSGFLNNLFKKDNDDRTVR
jgi:hypothetical protein